jgi:hypothetical protein
MIEMGESSKTGALDAEGTNGLVKSSLFRRLLKKVQMQGGARGAD